MLSKSLILSILFLSGLSLGFGQGPKDTLYFEWDKDYILTDRTSAQEKKLMLTQVQKEQEENGIEGYFYILIDTVLTGFKADTVRNLKREVERKEYYFEGPYNKTVNKERLQAKLLDRHVVVFVNEDKLIIPRHISYARYYPNRFNGSLIDQRVRDTLVFTSGWDEIVSPWDGEVALHITNRKNLNFYFEIDEILDRDSFLILNVSKQAFHGDINDYVLRERIKKDVGNVNDHFKWFTFFEAYIVYFQVVEIFYRVRGVAYEI